MCTGTTAMSRSIRQLITCGGSFYALADDNTLWCLTDAGEWRQREFPELPQDDGRQQTTASLPQTLLFGGSEPFPLPEEPRPDLFPVFWERYGYKKNKKGARRAWDRLSPEQQASALRAVPDYVSSTSIPPDNSLTLRAHPATWLNAERWTDEATQAHPQSDPGADEDVLA